MSEPRRTPPSTTRGTGRGPAATARRNVGQHVQGGGHAVALPPPVVADHDAIHPGLHRRHRIRRRQQPLYHAPWSIPHHIVLDREMVDFPTSI